MNSNPILFNRKILDKYLSAYKTEQITDYEIKRAEMARWKKAVETGDLQKTKETSVQGKFLGSVFEKVLGYSSFLSGGEWNQVQEFKSKLDGSEADGALGFFTAETKIIRAAVELKDANTNLDKKQHRSNHLTPVEQAFSYAHKNGSGCSWVIVSNFVDIRLYKSSSSLEYERFLITDLNAESEFKRFYFLLCKDNLIEKSGKSLVDKIYDDNEQARVEISNEFYNDYKKLRADLFQALKENNTEVEDMALFSKSQKILDRFIFVCFCESRRLLPKNAFAEIIERTKNYNSFVKEKISLWQALRGFFHSIDKGNPPLINGYNGGLFKQDEVLDELIIPDNVLERFAKLTAYDFDSELNVNILGHIFEQSISDLEQFKAELAGTPVDRQTSKQKADGIFYTPDYVTKFIVEKTIGRWLEDEKAKIKRKLKLKPKEIPEETAVFWEKYIESLKAVRVLDPACGSGAFLNQAFDYLGEQGKYAADMYHSLSIGQQIDLFSGGWDTHILQNNLFGVDLNIESVEITKLSLWLKTARSSSELASLDDNIKCGNSIINSHEIVGELAFDWSAEFPSVMEQGGFDIVIGNPPYGASLSQAEKDYISENYATTEGRFDTYKTFLERGINLLKPDGYIGYIIPNTFLVLENGAFKLREMLYAKNKLLDLVELFNVFTAAVVEPVIIILNKSEPQISCKFNVISVPRQVVPTSAFINDGILTEFAYSEMLESENLIFNYRANEEAKTLRNKLRMYQPLRDFFDVCQGIIPYGRGEGKPPQTSETLKNKPYTGHIKHSDEWFPYIRGKTMNRYLDAWDGEYIHYGLWLCRPRKKENFLREKLFIRQTSDYPVANYDNTGKFSNDTLHCILPRNTETLLQLKYLLGLINSRLLKWVFQYDNFTIVNQPLAQTKVIFVERLPIVVTNDQSQIISLVDRLLENCQARFDKAKQFTDYLSAVYAPKTITEKLSEFYKLNFKGFADELKKQKVKLTPKQEMELMPLFNDKVKELAALSQIIERLDNELDDIVFALYGLTESERAVVERI